MNNNTMNTPMQDDSSSSHSSSPQAPVAAPAQALIQLSQAQTAHALDPCHVHDAKAAHFLRHEVKNGVLAAMDIVGSLQEAYSKLQMHQKQQQALANASASSSQQPGVSMEESLLTNHLTDLNKTLGELLGRTVECAMTLEVVHGDYGPAVEAVDLPSLLHHEQPQDQARFPLDMRDSEVPQLMLDPNLMKTIHRNALSNACKFGREQGQVTTSLHYDQVRQLLRMQVVNEPGAAHEQLVWMTPAQKACIFQEHTQLPLNQSANRVMTMAEGNGAWVMQNCARAMGGHCRMDFEPTRTVLTFDCPAQVSREWMAQQQSASLVTHARPLDIQLPSSRSSSASSSSSSKHSKKEVAKTAIATQEQEEPKFELPENTWCIVVEDSAIQRKMLQRYLARSGVPSERCLILGKTPEEIFEFIEVASKLIRENKRDNVLILMDEHLDIVEGGTVSKTVSGSYSVQKLRESLEPCDECRLLSLIRSANDSMHEQRLYQNRAHGFIAKGPIKHGNLLEAIKPWWQQRFDQPKLQVAKALSPKRAKKLSVPVMPSRKRRSVSTAFLNQALTSQLSFDRSKLLGQQTNNANYNDSINESLKKERSTPLRSSSSTPAVFSTPGDYDRLRNYIFARAG